MKKPIVWYVLADAARARIVTQPDAAGPYLLAFAEDAAPAQARPRDLVSDRPGRIHESATTARHALVPRRDLHRREEGKFLRTVLAYLNRASARGSFDRLVIYAAPHCLEALRNGLDPATARKVQSAHAKDLTKVPLAALPAHFAQA